MNSDDEKKIPDDSRSRDLSPGKLLVWARERANLTSEQVAKELYMTLSKVRALESDDYRHMGADTFTRGYLRAYANLVHLDVVQVLAAYDRHAQKHGLVEQLIPRRVESANKPLWQFALLMLLVLFAFWLVSVWFFDNRQASDYERAAPLVPAVAFSQSALTGSAVTGSSLAVTSSAGPVSSAASSTVAEPLLSSAAALLASPLTTASSAASSALSAAVSSLPNSAAAAPGTELVSSVQQANTSGFDEISFQFSEECWLEVSDSRGDVLAADLQAPGSRLQLKGKAPFEVKLGNAPAVKIELNGEAIALVPALGTNVLSLKVGQVAGN